MRAVVLVAALGACGRIAFGPLSGNSGDASIVGDAHGDSGDSSDSGNVGSAAPCSTNPMLGASGCLAGSGPYDLWVFRDATAGIAGDSSGRGCAPLTSTGTLTSDGIDVSTGTVGNGVGDSAGAISAIAAGNGATLELWLHTTSTPASNVLVAALGDGIGPRLAFTQSASDSGGEVNGAAATIGYGLENIPSGADFRFVVEDDGTMMTVRVSGASGGYAVAPGFSSWDPPTGRVLFGGPWSGVIVRAAVYDRALTAAENSCLVTAGPLAIP